MTAFDTLMWRLGGRADEPLRRHTTLGIGGPADWYVTVTSNDALAEAARAAREDARPIFMLGSGSNILVGDSGIRGLVIEDNATGVEMPSADGLASDAIISADAGVPFARLSRATARAGWSGLEWAAGIPGSLGGAVIYNAGAYGGCLADVLEEIDVIAPDGQAQRLGADELSLDYRRSDFTRGRLREYIVTRVRVRVERGDAPASLERIAELETRRKASTPPGRSAGSTFRNPTGHAAWWLIDQVGLRGRRVGGAQVSEKHSNYFINAADASAAEMTGLMRLAQRRVHEQFGVQLEPELTSVGEGFA